MSDAAAITLDSTPEISEIVALDSTATSAIENISIPHKNGTLPASWSALEDAEAAVILIHDGDGPDEMIQQLASQLAAQGFACVAPDFFANQKAPSDDGEVARQDFLLSLSDADIVSEILSVVDWLVLDGAPAIGVVGCGWGGAYALMAGAHDARLKAIVDIGGVLSYPVSTPNRLASPLNFVGELEGALFAAYPGEDPQWPEIEIARLRGRLIEHDKIGEVKTYTGAPPNFWRDATSPSATLLWRRVADFLREHLIEEDETPAFGEGYPNEESRLHA